MPSKLPDFHPITRKEMETVWREIRRDDVRRLCLEVEHYRRVIDEIERLRLSIERVWHDEVGGQLVALYNLRLLLKAERERFGFPRAIGSDDDDPIPETVPAP